MSTDKARRGRPKGSGLDDRVHLDALKGLISSDPSLKPTTAIKMLGITDPSAIRRLRDKFRDLGSSGELETQNVSEPHRESLEQVSILPKSIVAQSKASDLPGSVTAVLERMTPDKPMAEPAPHRLRIVAAQPASQAQSSPDAVVLKAAPAAQEARASAASGSAAPSGKTSSQSHSEPGASDKEPPRSKPVSGTPKSQSHGDEISTLLVRWYALGMTAALSTAEAQMKVMESVLKVPPVALAIKQQLMFCELAKSFIPGSGKPPKRRR